VECLKVGIRGAKKKQLILFVDFAKAFDTVDRRLLLNILKHRISRPWVLQLL